MNNPRDVPVSSFLAISIIFVFSLYITTLIKTIPCGKDLMSVFYSNFVHVDVYHLSGNLLALYALARVEKDIGSKPFAGLIGFLLMFNSILEVMLHKMFPDDVPCSIGFSGILFGIAAYELITTKKIDVILVLSIIFMVVLPSYKNAKASLSSHIIGALSGIIAGFYSLKIRAMVE